MIEIKWLNKNGVYSNSCNKCCIEDCDWNKWNNCDKACGLIDTKAELFDCNKTCKHWSDKNNKKLNKI